MPTARPDTATIASGAALWAGRDAPSYSVVTVESDGIITPSSQPSSRWYGNALYTSWVDSIGRTGITRYDRETGTPERTVLSLTNQDNSHNNGSIEFLPDGKVLVAWSKHNSSEGCQVRVSSSAYDVGAFGSAVALTDGARTSSYADVWKLSQTGKYYVATRYFVSGTRYDRKTFRTTDGVTFDSPATWVYHPSHRPYPKYLSDGVSRVHIVATTGGPSEVASGLHYAYMQLDESNVEQFYDISGASLGTGGLNTSAVTAFVPSTSGDCWAYDLAFGPDGELWLIYVFFPTGAVATDQRLMFVKTTGGRTGWATPVQIAVIGAKLYVGEDYSHAGAVFDATDPTIMWACLRNGNPKHEVFKYTTDDNGATWSQAEQITSDSVNDNWQPVSPPGHNGYCPVVWITGTYTSWNAGFSSSVKALIRD